VHRRRDVHRPGVRLPPTGIGDDPFAEAVRVPRLHRRALVRLAEVGEHRFTRLDVGKVALDDLRLVSFGAAPEVAAHRVDRLPAEPADEALGAATVLVRVRRSGEVDPRHGRTVRGMNERSTDFVALGQPGSETYAGLETFPNPGVGHVEMRSDELTAVCPVTGQPDLYDATISYRPGELCLESKSLKLYLSTFRNEGAFCEALAVRIRDDVAKVLGLAAEDVQVTLEQKARGGITIVAAT
jgi:7-cyano-7-deazaguanine reductase